MKDGECYLITTCIRNFSLIYFFIFFCERVSLSSALTPKNFVSWFVLPAVPCASFGYSPTSGERSMVGRVGLRNLGNTCYVNSCLQQLFMMGPVRNGLLSLDSGETDQGR